MPFLAPFRNYAAGDLLYGLRDNRYELALQFPDLEVLYTIDQIDIFTVDQGHAGMFHNADFVAALGAHTKYSSVLNYDLVHDTNWINEPTRAAAHAKRKCKGGLEWVTKNTTRHIHFMLDGLSLVDVPNKSYAGYGPTQISRDNPVGKAVGVAWDAKERSITGAELRWIYRNRNNVHVRAQVQFWRTVYSWQTISHGRHERVGTIVQCPPPWDDPAQPAAVRAAWRAYVPTTLGV